MSKPDNGDKVVLQLNRPALERLLGNDTELEVQLRQQVVEEFLKKHLKQLVSGELISKVSQEVQKIVYEELKAHVGSLSSNYSAGRTTYTVWITEKVKEILTKAVEQETRAIVGVLRDKIAEEVEAQALDRINRYEGRMLNLVQDRFKQALEILEAGLDKRLDEGYERRVQEEISRRLTLAASQVATNRLVPSEP